MSSEDTEWSISPELKEWIGVESDLGTEVVETGSIKRFADAIKDPNPLWRNDEFAANTQYEGIIAPPTFIHSFRTLGYPNIQPKPMPWKNTTALNGGNVFEFYRSLRPGDVISGKVVLTDIYSRISKRMGPMIFTVFEMTYTDKQGELVAKQTSTSIWCQAQ